jgi:hypothetical protein
MNPCSTHLSPPCRTRKRQTQPILPQCVIQTLFIPQIYPLHHKRLTILSHLEINITIDTSSKNSRFANVFQTIFLVVSFCVYSLKYRIHESKAQDTLWSSKGSPAPILPETATNRINYISPDVGQSFGTAIDMKKIYKFPDWDLFTCSL